MRRPAAADEVVPGAAASGGGRAERGRRLVVAALLTYFAVLGGAWAGGLARPWSLLGVAQMPVPFADLHNVLSAVDCAAQGHDVLVDNPCDAFGRPMNYPRPWLLLGAIGLGGEHLVPAGIVLAVAFLAAALLVVGGVDRRDGAVAAALLCSPSVMLLVERGNVDAVLFALCAVAAWLAARERAAPAATAVLTVAAVLKLFPVFALPAPALVPGRTGRRLAEAALAAGALAALAWWSRADLAAIAAVVPRGVLLSYGANVLPVGLVGPEAPDARAAFALAAGVAGAWGARRRRAVLAPTGHAGPAFAIGALVLVGTFALGSNWAYRLSFLVLLLPQLAAWRREGAAASRRAWALATAILLAAWCVADPFAAQLAAGPRFAIWIVGQVATWALALALASVLGGLAARSLSAVRGGAR